MKSNYEVRTQHTKKYFSDFSKFVEAMKGTHPSFTMFLFGAVFVSFAFFVYRKQAGENKAWIMFLVLGIIVFFFAFMRRRMAVNKLAKGDQFYQDGTVIDIEFVVKGFRVTVGENTQYCAYDSISYICHDNDNYYISVNNEDIYILPYSDFTSGSPQDFLAFIEKNSGQKSKQINLTLPQHWAAFKVAWKNRPAAQNQKKAENSKKKESK